MNTGHPFHTPGVMQVAWCQRVAGTGNFPIAGIPGIADATSSVHGCSALDQAQRCRAFQKDRENSYLLVKMSEFRGRKHEFQFFSHSNVKAVTGSF